VYSQHILLFVNVGTNALCRVNSEVTAITDWHSLGIALKLSPSTLEEIGANYKDPARCMTEVLVTWLRQHQTPHSWKILVSALMSPSVNRTDVAQKIAAVQCKPFVYVSCSMETQGNIVALFSSLHPCFHCFALRKDLVYNLTSDVGKQSDRRIE